MALKHINPVNDALMIYGIIILGNILLISWGSARYYTIPDTFRFASQGIKQLKMKFTFNTFSRGISLLSQHNPFGAPWGVTYVISGDPLGDYWTTHRNWRDRCILKVMLAGFCSC